MPGDQLGNQLIKLPLPLNTNTNWDIAFASSSSSTLPYKTFSGKSSKCLVNSFTKPLKNISFGGEFEPIRDVLFSYTPPASSGVDNPKPATTLKILFLF